MEHKINGKNYCRCDTPDETGRRSECGLPDVQCPSCKQKDVIDTLTEENIQLRKVLTPLCEPAYNYSEYVRNAPSLGALSNKIKGDVIKAEQLLNK
ncbi:hypothetical protein NVP1063O_133 [Vibrio phage 1.063.O._10N.261.45.C7]|nr:hypothetical protein NVP1063O_133 [Vibrio phage 1.063.O._10N.261.45.C7]